MKVKSSVGVKLLKILSVDFYQMAKEQLKELKQAEKAEVASYFNGMGFERWNRIYSNSDEVNKVQRNIRIGHQNTVDDVLSWVA